MVNELEKVMDRYRDTKRWSGVGRGKLWGWKKEALGLGEKKLFD